MHRTLLAVLVSTAALAAAGCGSGEPAEVEPGPWVRIDLWSRTPTVEQQVAADPQAFGEPFEAAIGWLGAGEVRNVDRLTPWQLHTIPRRPAARARILAQEAGSRLAWSLDLPPVEPYLSLTPLGQAEGGCPCRFRVGVRDADGVIHELYRTPAQRVVRLAPAAAELDLAPFAGTRVEILLQVDLLPGADRPAGDGAAAPRALWASPAAYGRLATGRDPAAWSADGTVPPTEADGAEDAEREADLAASDGGEPNAAGRRADGDEERPVNVLLLGLDTLRYDRVGPHRIGPSLTPNLDALAAEGDTWDAAFSTFNSTNPSFSSILTGLYGKNHGVYDLLTPLPPEPPTLAEQFAAAGYDTFALISARHLGAGVLDIQRGFEQVEVSEQIDAGELIADRAMEWLGGRETPWFAWLHFFDPHIPHTAPQPYGLGFRHASAAGLAPVGGWLPFRQPGPLDYVEQMLAGRKELYDGEVAYLDRQLGRVLDFLASRGVLEDTVVAVVADHGESLGEHGIQCHHAGLYDQSTHVPLMIRWPDRLLDGPEWLPQRGRRFSGLVQTLDLFPTLLAASGLEPPPSDGVDLRRLTPEPDGPETDDDPPGRRFVFAEHAGRQGEMIRSDRWKYLTSMDNPLIPDGVYLFDLEHDPGETNNLAGQGLEIETRLAELLERWRSITGPAPGTAPSAGVSEEDRRELRSLGYLQ